jgi:methionine biosynthesis protein MetW
MFKLKDWISEDSKVLDLGCGEGSLLDDLKKEKSVSGLGIEIDAGKIKSCLEKGISVIEQDIDNGLENFGNQTFDFVVMSQSIQALKRPELALEEIVRVGKECIVSIPNFANIKCRLQLFFKGQMPVSNALPHDWFSTPNLHLCSLEDFEELCKKCKISIIERKLSKTNGEESFLMKLFPNLFSEVALYKLIKKS